MKKGRRKKQKRSNMLEKRRDWEGKKHGIRTDARKDVQKNPSISLFILQQGIYCSVNRFTD